jgi:hypothetical protein
MFALVWLVSAVFGGFLSLEATAIVIAIGVITTPVFFALAIMFGVPAYLIASFTKGDSEHSLRGIDAFAWAPIRWASGVAVNILDRFTSVLSGKPSQNREFMKHRRDYYYFQNNPSLKKPDRDELDWLDWQENGATTILVIAVVSDAIGLLLYFVLS